MTHELAVISQPPAYCQYVAGPCDQEFVEVAKPKVFVAYAGQPETISSTIEAAIAQLQSGVSRWDIVGWKNLAVGGQIIFCEICKTMRHSVTVVADVTTMNFNVLFEIGYALGLGLAVLPIRDTSFGSDRRDFAALALLDSLGYIDFTNAAGLAKGVRERLPANALPVIDVKIHRDSPMYVMKGPLDTEGTVQLMSVMKKSGLRFRTYDPVETPRLSLLEARRQVAGSVGVVCNLLSPERTQSRVHNAQSALVAGLALAQQKFVLMLQEGEVTQPLDYRDVVVSYNRPSNIPPLVRPLLRGVLDALQRPEGAEGPQRRRKLLQELDLGDVAAENEIVGLRNYFVHTGPASQARQGHARLVVGRKGSGKTAIFYDVRDGRPVGHDHLTLDLKPEGHQFAEMREFLDGLGSGLQEHTLVAFWNYILLTELARKALDQDRGIARVDPARFAAYRRLEDIYERHNPGDEHDFAQRLRAQVERVAVRLGAVPADKVGQEMTRLIYAGDVKELTEAVSGYLGSKDSVWLLVDNIDKGWPVRGATNVDILIVRALLDASRKLQHQLEARGIEFECLVFLRSDIFEHLRRETPDKGKDTAIRLDWEDRTIFQEIVRRRVATSTDLKDDFATVWPQICDPLVDSEHSFGYIVDRTLMRPRDLLQFLQKAIDVALNRGHDRIEAEDLLQAEKGYSEDLLLATMFEIADTQPDLADLLYGFQASPVSMGDVELAERLRQTGLADDVVATAIDLLLWTGFLGVASSTFPEPKYAYDVQGNLRRLLYPVAQGDGTYVVHPAFRTALDIGS